MNRFEVWVALALAGTAGACGDDETSGGGSGASGAIGGAGLGSGAIGGGGGNGGAPGGTGGEATGGSAPGFVVSGDVGVFEATMPGTGDLYVGLKAAGQCSTTAPWFVFTKKAGIEHDEEAWGVSWSFQNVPPGDYVGYAFFDVDDSAEGEASPQPDAGDWVPEDDGTPDCPPVVVEDADVGAVIVELDGTL